MAPYDIWAISRHIAILSADLSGTESAILNWESSDSNRAIPRSL